MRKANAGRGVSLLRVLKLQRHLEGLPFAPPLSDLAKTFDVTTRTIRRDLDLLAKAGFTIPKCRCDEGNPSIDREPPEPDGATFRGRESSSFDREQQASIMRDLKR